jgi:hypothetical protein
MAVRSRQIAQQASVLIYSKVKNGLETNNFVIYLNNSSKSCIILDYETKRNNACL